MERLKIPELEGLNEGVVTVIVENWMDEKTRRLRVGKQPLIQGVDEGDIYESYNEEKSL